MLYAILLSLLVGVAASQPLVAQISITPGPSAHDVKATILQPFAAGTRLYVKATSSNEVLLETVVRVQSRVVSVGSVKPRQSVSIQTYTIDPVHGNHTAQTFDVESRYAQYVASIAWVPNGTLYTLTTVPVIAETPFTRWTAVCDSNTVEYQPWCVRSSSAMCAWSVSDLCTRIAGPIEACSLATRMAARPR